MKSNSLTYQTLKNVSYGILNIAVPIFISVVVTRIFVRRLGETDYGIYVLANTIIGFLGLTDLGLSGALTKYISLYHSQKQGAAMKETIDSASSLFLIIGFLGFSVFFILGKFFLPTFKIIGASQSHIFVVFILAGLIFFVNSVNSVFTIIPAALQRFDIAIKLNLAQLCFFSLTSLGLVLLGMQLKAVMLINLFSVIATSFAFRYYSKKIMPGLKVRLRWKKEQIKQLYSFGLVSSLASISIGSLNNLDRLIIPAFLGPVQLSYYSLPGNVAQKTSMIVGNISNMFFPLATSVSATGELERLGGIFRKIVRNLSILAAASTASIMVFAYKILYFWVGPVFAAKGFRVLEILAVTYFILAFFGILYHFLMGAGKEKRLAVFSMVMAVVNLFLIIILIKPQGIVGVAWAYLFGTLPVAYLLYWTEKYFFKAQYILAFYAKLGFRLAVTAVVYFVLIKFLVLPHVNSLLSVIIVGPLCVFFYMLLYKLFGFFEKEDLAIFYAFGRKILEKFPFFKPRLP